MIKLKPKGDKENLHCYWLQLQHLGKAVIADFCKVTKRNGAAIGCYLCVETQPTCYSPYRAVLFGSKATPVEKGQWRPNPDAVEQGATPKDLQVHAWLPFKYSVIFYILKKRPLQQHPPDKRNGLPLHRICFGQTETFSDSDFT